VRRTTRRRLTHLALYLVLLAAAVAVAVSVDWPTMRANFWADGLGENWHDLIVIGIVNSAKYTAIAFVGGLALALVLALMKLSPILAYRWLATAYIEFFRALPALVVILTMAFGVTLAFPSWNPPGGALGTAVIALIMVAGAYMAETLRAGIQSVPKGQAEAARSLGMSGAHTMRSVVLPQAVRIVIPPLTNEFVLLIKDTSLLFVVGLLVEQRELTQVARDFLASGPTAGTATSLIQVSMLYLIITLPLTRLVAWLEKRQQRTR
jgi:polar amino acid transport system permease protein